MESGVHATREEATFSAQYKGEVVALVRSSGKSVGQVASELDLTETAVRAWVQQSTIDRTRGPQAQQGVRARARRRCRRTTDSSHREPTAPNLLDA